MPFGLAVFDDVWHGGVLWFCPSGVRVMFGLVGVLRPTSKNPPPPPGDLSVAIPTYLVRMVFCYGNLFGDICLDSRGPGLYLA